MRKIANNELSDQAYNMVRAMIISKELKPGQKIVQDKLAEDLGISRTPLRTALQMLEGEGLIDSVPRRGVIVKEFSDYEIVEIYECRAALEGVAIRLFTERATVGEIASLKSMFKPFLQGEIDLEEYKRVDAEFHVAIMKGSKNEYLHRLFRQGNLLVSMDAIGLLRFPDETLAEHMNIIDAIEKRDADLAESLAKLHLNKTKELILKRINE
ncbi:GntR family transcriptional regulator [uncultured Zobellia sp.]|uniref:GntR family transcriptional regulator n=1 Tax=uncultured Zobellia sp. TaxID=255433 RepID=UPI002593961F|nr:GntR family transcriptional regulator [uncultured Zobellia sp.]